MRIQKENDGGKKKGPHSETQHTTVFSQYNMMKFVGERCEDISVVSALISLENRDMWRKNDDD